MAAIGTPRRTNYPPQNESFEPELGGVLLRSRFTNLDSELDPDCHEGEAAAQTFAGMRTQSWDVALADPAPTFLEINFGGDLNLHQLAQEQDVLDEQYRTHLRRCGYKGRL